MARALLGTAEEIPRLECLSRTRKLRRKLARISHNVTERLRAGFMSNGGRRNQPAGAPSFALFAKGGIPRISSTVSTKTLRLLSSMLVRNAG